jgi:fructose 1,6-bisphosphatase
MRPDWIEKLRSIDYNKHWDLTPKKLPVTTNAISFQKLINYVGNNFDLIVINAEGSDSEIVASVNWGQFTNCKMICVEKEFLELELYADIIKQLYDQGSFILTDQTPCNSIYRRV